MKTYLINAILLNMGKGEVNEWKTVKAYNTEHAIKCLMKRFLTVEILSVQKVPNENTNVNLIGALENIEGLEVNYFYNPNHDVNQLEIIYDNAMIAIVHFNKNLDGYDIDVESKTFKVFGYANNCNTENIYHNPLLIELVLAVKNIIEKVEK